MSMPRRQKRNLDLPDNLYPNGRYFKYIHPITKRAISVNRPRAEAIRLAKDTNAQLLKQCDYGLLGTAGDFDTLLDDFVKDYLPTKEYRPVTIKAIKQKLNQYKGQFPPIQHVTVLSLKDFLARFKPHSYIKHRQLWIDIFKYAISEGLVQFNCAEATLRKRAPKRQRERLTGVSYKLIHDVADQWFKNTMELARISLQRRGDLCAMRYADIKGSYFYIQQSKSAGKESANLKILMWPELSKSIKATKTVPLSPYILHRHSKRRANDKQKLDNSVKPDFLSKTFAKYAKLAGVENVTFHEIRSLGARQYEQQGYSKAFIQALLGHAKESMTDVYLDDDSVKWTEISM
jgi:integrase